MRRAGETTQLGFGFEPALLPDDALPARGKAAPWETREEKRATHSWDLVTVGQWSCVCGMQRRTERIDAGRWGTIYIDASGGKHRRAPACTRGAK